MISAYFNTAKNGNMCQVLALIKTSNAESDFTPEFYN